MVHGRSYWELPDDLMVQVKKPAIDTLREWDPNFRREQAAGSQIENEDARKRREEVLLHAAAKATSLPAGMAALQERMAQAAQRKKETEMKRRADERQREDKSVGTNDASAYLEMVRQLQHVDKETDSTGGKWLVR